MAPPGARTVVVRFGELGTKSPPVRRRMVRRLASNVEALLRDRGIDADVERRHARLLVRADEPDVEGAAAAAADAFGVVSASPARSIPPRLDDIADALAGAARDRYDGSTFAVEARRTGDHPFTSEDIGEAGGAAVWGAIEGEFDPAVDLDDPDHAFRVECRDDEAFVFTRTVDGPGGLPLGSQSTLVALLSGGIDSPVAAYEAMTRGSPVVPVYLDLGDYGGPDHRARAVEAARTLAAYAPHRDERLYCVPAGDVADLLADRMDRGRMLSLRRFSYRVAEHVARDVGADGIVTGESIGQKSSQTARNLAVTSPATDLPVHRPLLAHDKDWITERARSIGTFDTSTVPAGCERFAPEHPETSGGLDGLLRVEPDDLFERAERAAADAERLDL